MVITVPVRTHTRTYTHIRCTSALETKSAQSYKSLNFNHSLSKKTEQEKFLLIRYVTSKFLGQKQNTGNSSRFFVCLSYTTHDLRHSSFLGGKTCANELENLRTKSTKFSEWIYTHIYRIKSKNMYK